MKWFHLQERPNGETDYECSNCACVVSFDDPNADTPSHCPRCDKQKDKPMPTPRIHHKERIAHAMGHEIEYKNRGETVWSRADYPQWHPNTEYRVKPEPKSDVVLDLFASANGLGISGYRAGRNSNLRLTFDGGTGRLKAAEVIE